MAHPCPGAPGEPCGDPTDGWRCARHAAIVDADRQRRHHNPAYDQAAWRRRRGAAVSRHVKRHGLVCPGYGRPPHRVARRSDLTADHPVALANGGTHDQELDILCRSCNGRKGAR